MIEQGLIDDLCVETGLASSDHRMVRSLIEVEYMRRFRKGGRYYRESMDYKRADFEGMRRKFIGVDRGAS